MMYKLMSNIKKFWCLTGFVAIIFIILALKCIYIAFFFCNFWNLLSAALISIFAYWWIVRVLAKPSRYGRKKSCHYKNNCRDLDL